MNLIEDFPVLPLSSMAIELTVLGYLKEFCPDHYYKPGPLEICDLRYALWASHKYKDFCVPEYEDSRIEADTRFSDKTIEQTERYMKKLDNDDYRSRFTYAHEAAHIILHSAYVEKELPIAARSFAKIPHGEIKAFQNPEWQANQGAGTLLMPTSSLIPLLKELMDSGNSKEKIADIIHSMYHVSAASAEVRIKKLMSKQMEGIWNFVRK